MKFEENKCMDNNVKNKNNSENNENKLFNNIEEGEEDSKKIFNLIINNK